MKATIYKITNTLNDKVYVGQTWKTAQERFDRHCAEARWKNMISMPIVFAIEKYGFENFKVHTIEELVNCSQDEVNEREVYWGLELNTLSPFGYNLRLGGANGIMSEETKKKIGAANKGKKRTEISKEKMRASHIGYKVKESTKKKLSIINTGKTLSKEHAAKIALSNTGKIQSNETKEKMRIKKLKYTYEVTSPDGHISITNNLQQFSEQNNLNPGHMASVASCKINHYKKWKVKKLSDISDFHE